MWLVLEAFLVVWKCLILHWLIAVGGQSISSSECIFWTVRFLPLFSGDWLHIRGKCHVIDGDRRLGRKEPKAPPYCGEESGDQEGLLLVPDSGPCSTGQKHWGS